MRVLLVSEYWPPHTQGGGEISAQMFAYYLREEGYEVDVVTSFFSDEEWGKSIEDGINVFRLTKTGSNPESFIANVIRHTLYPLSVRTCLRKLDTKDCDIVVFMNGTSALGYKKGSVPSIAQVNSPIFFTSDGRITGLGGIIGRPLSFLLMKWRQAALRRFDVLVPNSEFMADRLFALGFDKSKVVVVPNIVERCGYVTKKENKLLRILYLGGYRKEKGVFVLLDALKRLSVLHQFKASFYGDGPVKEEMRKYASNAIAINDAVSQDCVCMLIKEHDIIVYPSLLQEAMPRTVLEAMLAGKVVVVSDRGGASSIIDQHINGVAYDGLDSYALEDALKGVLTAPSLRERVRRNAPKAVRAHLPQNVMKAFKKSLCILGIRV